MDKQFMSDLDDVKNPANKPEKPSDPYVYPPRKNMEESTSNGGVPAVPAFPLVNE